MFKLARSRPMAAALRAATRVSSTQPFLPLPRSTSLT